jgi:hypothetical protein
MRMRDPTLAGVVLAIVAMLVLGDASPARANIAQSRTDGETFAPLLARVPSTFRVDSEDLEFRLDADLSTASVTATYRMSNPGPATAVDVAFVFVRDDRGTGQDAAPSVSVDGTQVEYTVLSDAEQLVGKLLVWMSAHPAVEQEIVRLGTLDRREYQDLETLRGLLRANGARCGACERLVGSYGELQRGTPSLVDGSLGEIVVDASRELIPEAVEQMTKGWSTESPPGRMTWLGFRLELAEGATRAVVVRYRHVAGADLASHVNTTFTYHYLLSPAKSWASFGPLHIVVLTPPGARVWGSRPLAKGLSGYRADFASLPDGELTFEVMSMNGVWLGMTTSSGYWGVLLLSLTVATTFIGIRLGRLESRARSGCLGSLLRASGTAGLCMAASVLLAGLLGAIGPSRALGFGYGPGIGIIFFTLVSGFVGAVIHIAVAKRARTIRPRE